MQVERRCGLWPKKHTSRGKFDMGSQEKLGRVRLITDIVYVLRDLRPCRASAVRVARLQYFLTLLARYRCLIAAVLDKCSDASFHLLAVANRLSWPTFGWSSGFTPSTAPLSFLGHNGLRPRRMRCPKRLSRARSHARAAGYKPGRNACRDDAQEEHAGGDVFRRAWAGIGVRRHYCFASPGAPTRQS